MKVGEHCTIPWPKCDWSGACVKYWLVAVWHAALSAFRQMNNGLCSVADCSSMRSPLWWNVWMNSLHSSNFFDLEQGWRIFLRARTEIADNFRRSIFACRTAECTTPYFRWFQWRVSTMGSYSVGPPLRPAHPTAGTARKQKHYFHSFIFR